MPVRDFTLLPGAALAAVRARAASALNAWGVQWGVDMAADAGAVSCERTSADLAGVAWDQTWNAGPRALWLACPATVPAALQQALFGADGGAEGHAASGAAAPAALAAEAAARALDALCGMLVAGLVEEEGGARPQRAMAAQPAAAVLARGAGTLLLTIRIGAATLRCLLDSAAVARLAPARVVAARTPLAPVNYLKALHATPVRLPVRVGQAQLGLGALMSVAVGDVIRLDCAVDAPVDVLGPHGGPLLRAYLGQTQGAVAVEIDSRH